MVRQEKLQMFCYKITNKINGKAYVGLTTKTVEARWYEHKTLSRATSPKAIIHRALKKYGIENFLFEVLYEASSLRELRMVERGAVATHGTMTPLGYNATAGGQGAISSPEVIAKIRESRKWYVISDETKEKISTTLRGRKIPLEVVEKIRAKNTGKKRSEECRRRLSAKHTGKKLTPEHVEKVACQLRGRKRPAHLIAKTVAKLIGKRHSPETKAKMSAARMGWNPSAETRAKMSAAKKGKKPWNWKGWKTPEAA